MKTNVFLKPKSTLPITGMIQWMLYAVFHPYLYGSVSIHAHVRVLSYTKSTIVMEGLPTIAKGRRFSGSSQDAAKEDVDSSLRTASRICGKYHFLLNNRITMVAAITPTPTDPYLEPQSRRMLGGIRHYDH